MAASLHCNTPQGHISKIMGSSLQLWGQSSASALTLGTPCTPHGAAGCGQGSPGHMCHLPTVAWGQSAFCRGVQTSWGLSPAPWASHLCHVVPCFCSWRGLGAVALPRALAHPWREPPVQGLWVQQGWCCSHGTGAGRTPRGTFLCPRWGQGAPALPLVLVQNLVLTLQGKGLQCSVPLAPATC